MSLKTTSPVSQKTIADHLNVSVATVSKALSNKADISESMRIKVETTAQKLGYKLRSTSFSRQQSVRSTQFIGVFIRRPIEGGAKNAPTYMDGMSKLASKHNISLVVQEWRSEDDPTTLISYRQQPAALKENLLSGILLGGTWPTDVVNSLGVRHQVVLFPQQTLNCKVDVVGIDHVSTMMQIVSRLKDLGHTKIGFLGKCTPASWACERFAGYVSAIERLGLTYNPDLVLDVDEVPMYNEGHHDYWKQRIDKIEQLRNQGVEAWVCSSDWPAYQLYRGMADRGYEIPRDLSITGFDDTEPVHLGCPLITTVKVPHERVGEATLQRLLDRLIDPSSPPCHTQYKCQLMAHGTNGPPSYFK